MNETLQSALALVALAASAPVMFGFICRAKVLAFGKTKPLPTIFHMAGGLHAMAVAFSAWRGAVSVSELLGLVMGGAWLFWSYYSWRGPRPPEHVLTEKAEVIHAPGT